MAQTKAKKAASPQAKPAAKSKRSSSKRAAANQRKASSNGHPSKARLPLIAGGAALAGTVGGVLIGASRSGSKVLGVSLPQPKRVRVKVSSKDLARAAREVGRFGENVGDLTAELKKAREGLAGDNKHSSPIEVLLRGLTTRR